MTTAKESALQGRAASNRHAWSEAYAALSSADREASLEPADLELLAGAARMVGRDAESLDCWARAHRRYGELGDRLRSARCAIWIAMPLLVSGEGAQASGWIARARRLVDGAPADCAEHGYLAHVAGLQAVFGGDAATAAARFREAARIGERCGDADLIALGRLGEGRALVRLGSLEQGAALLDEVMVDIAGGEVSPTVVGILYCSMLDACQEMFDLGRAREWTQAVAEWCRGQPEMAGYRGECLVHRAEVLQVNGDWDAAREEAHHACEALDRSPPHRAIGAALYRLGELHRLRGDLAAAEEAYRRASQAGRDPQPGLARLRLMQGATDAAHAAIARALGEAEAPRTRCALLPVAVEAALAAGDIDAARAAAEELGRYAASLGAPLLRAASAYAAALVRLAEGDARAAVAGAREACQTWHDLAAPYDAARARVLIGAACRALGDADSAELEFGGARRTFERLGAAPELTALESLTGTPQAAAGGPLTEREMEVLRLVATGRTNRAIAGTLGISEKTVARHVSNLFGKLALPSRAAATAYAYERGLVARRPDPT
jgi:ATP/maltotriose-dependent transcriptional regulator MalT